MARIMVLATNDAGIVTMDEIVLPLHMEDEHLSLQIIERVAWAVADAETVVEAEESQAQVGGGIS